MSLPLEALALSRHCLHMNKTFHALLLTCLLFLVACGKSTEPVIEVDESKVPKPTDESGNVQMVDRTFTVKLAAPTPAWSVKISEIWVVGSEVWVLSDLSEKKGGMVTQVVTEISDSVKTDAPDIEAVNYIIGKTGGWKPSGQDIVLIYSKEQILDKLNNGFQIWPKE